MILFPRKFSRSRSSRSAAASGKTYFSPFAWPRMPSVSGWPAVPSRRKTVPSPVSPAAMRWMRRTNSQVISRTAKRGCSAARRESSSSSAAGSPCARMKSSVSLPASDSRAIRSASATETVSTPRARSESLYGLLWISSPSTQMRGRSGEASARSISRVARFTPGQKPELSRSVSSILPFLPSRRSAQKSVSSPRSRCRPPPRRARRRHRRGRCIPPPDGRSGSGSFWS